MSCPQKCQAAIMPAPGKPIEIREIALPELEPGSAMLRVEFSEVCGTDVHLQDGLLAGVPYPIVPGHVSVGVLEHIRGEMLDIEGKPFQEGDRVTFLDVHRTCHRCYHCLVAKASTRCPDRKVYGITYGLETGLTGGWAQYIHMLPGTICIRMNDVPSDMYMAGGCSLPTSLHAVERADVRIGDSVLVLGAGPVGLSTGAFARMRGALKVLTIGAPDARLETAKAMGADDAINHEGKSESDLIDWVQGHTGGRGSDVTIECTGNPIAVAQAMRYTRDGGRLVIVGQYTNRGETSINPHLDINKKHLDIRGCWGSDYSHFHRGVQIMGLPMAKTLWSPMHLERYPLADINVAIDAVRAATSIKALVAPND